MARDMSSESKEGAHLLHSQDLLHIKEGISFDSLLIKKSKPYKVGPSSVLDRVKSFLPEMEKANKRLDEKIEEGSKEDLDIENVENCEGPIIEMNLALCPHDTSSDEEDDDEDDDDGDQSDESESVMDNSGDNWNCGEVDPQTLKLPGRGKKSKDGRTLIEEINQPLSHATDECMEERT